MKPLFKLLILFHLLIFVETKIFAEENNIVTFSNINNISSFIDESDYVDIIRESLFMQPEFAYAQSISAEKEFNLKYARRSRFGSITGNILNDESFERNITDKNSVRKRRDDTFDAIVELSQPIYSGGSISSKINMARAQSNSSSNEKSKTISQLILDANQIYITTALLNYLVEYSKDLLETVKPYRLRVKDRVDAGIMDSAEAAIFYVRYNQLETKVTKFISSSEKAKSRYSFFFKKDPGKLLFPKVNISKNMLSIKNSSYDVEKAKFDYEERKENIKSVRSNYLPQFGIRARYTKYDIDDDSNEDDIRGGLYFSLPLFSFGRGFAEINSAKATAEGSKNALDVAIKDDGVSESAILSDLNNSLQNRNIFIRSYEETVNQRKVLSDKLETDAAYISFLVEVKINEITQLEILLDNEYIVLQGYLSALHQNKQLNNIFRLDLN